MSTTGAFVVNRERLGAHRATEFDDVAGNTLKVDKFPAAVPNNRAHRQKSILSTVLQPQRQAGVTVEQDLITENAMAMLAVAF